MQEIQHTQRKIPTDARKIKQKEREGRRRLHDKYTVKCITYKTHRITYKHEAKEMMGLPPWHGQ